jgi:hypothetical protein
MKDENFTWVQPEMLSIKKLAKVLDCSPKTVRDWVYKDRKMQNPDPLPYYRIHGLVRFRLREVLEWVDRRRGRAFLLSKLLQ